MALTLALGSLIGGLFSYYGISKDGTDTFITSPPARFESPDVTELSMAEAIDVLVSKGYRVVAVGRGDVVLQEHGFRGQVLRVQGELGHRLRYCTARMPRCVAIDAPSIRHR